MCQVVGIYSKAIMFPFHIAEINDAEFCWESISDSQYKYVYDIPFWR